MSEELYFNDELRKCLNAAGLSDCGENDAWNYWYQRVHKAHDQAVDRVTEAQRAENAKLRELVKVMFGRINYECRCCSIFCSDWDEDNECCSFRTCARELGVEVDE